MKSFNRYFSSLLIFAVLIFCTPNAQAVTPEPPRNADAALLFSGNGSMTISNYVTTRKETLNINGIEQTVTMYYADDSTTITFNITSEDVNGDISILEWEDGTYYEHGDGLLGGEWGWPALHVLSLLEEAPIRQISITDLSFPVSEDDWSITYDSVGFYICSAERLGNSTENSVFIDVSSTAYYADAVKWAVDKGVTAGTTATTFSPNDTCTTAQILTFLWRAKGSPAPVGSNPFPDVTADAYYADAAAWAYENGLVSGSSFGGNTPCTRAATVTYLWKLAGSPAAGTAAFTDVDAGAECAQAVAWAVEEGITAGTSATTFSPNTTCTRGQIVTFLYRVFAQ